jgi:DNA-binding MarR family transcriptional regulator
MQKTELITGIIELQRRINRYMRRHTLGAWMELNITIPQLRSLFFIANHGTTNFTKLAAALGVTPSNVTGIVDRLLEQGLVSRQENQEDRRQLILRVTDKGENIVTGLRDRRARHISEILSHLTQEELNTIYKGLGILARAAETHEEKP